MTRHGFVLRYNPIGGLEAFQVVHSDTGQSSAWNTLKGVRGWLDKHLARLEQGRQLDAGEAKRVRGTPRAR